MCMSAFSFENYIGQIKSFHNNKILFPYKSLLLQKFHPKLSLQGLFFYERVGEMFLIVKWKLSLESIIFLEKSHTYIYEMPNRQYSKKFFFGNPEMLLKPLTITGGYSYNNCKPSFLKVSEAD